MERGRLRTAVAQDEKYCLRSRRLSISGQLSYDPLRKFMLPGKGNLMLSSAATLAQVLSVVVGVVITVLSFNATRQKEVEARQLEAAKPFLQLRQNLYTEAVKAAAILANPDTHTQEELMVAKKRFGELYVSELSMVEAREVEQKMIALAGQIYPELTKFTPAQDAAYNLAHALRDTFVASWRIDQ
jgi:hypothetical protein